MTDDPLRRYPDGFFIDGTFRTGVEIRAARRVCLLVGHDWQRRVGPCESVGCGCGSATHICARCGIGKLDWSVWRDWVTA